MTASWPCSGCGRWTWGVDLRPTRSGRLHCSRCRPALHALDYADPPCCLCDVDPDDLRDRCAVCAWNDSPPEPREMADLPPVPTLDALRERAREHNAEVAVLLATDPDPDLLAACEAVGVDLTKEHAR